MRSMGEVGRASSAGVGAPRPLGAPRAMELWRMLATGGRRARLGSASRLALGLSLGRKRKPSLRRRCVVGGREADPAAPEMCWRLCA